MPKIQHAFLWKASFSQDIQYVFFTIYNIKLRYQKKTVQGSLEW